MIFVKIVWLILSIVLKLQSIGKFIWERHHGTAY